MTGYSMLKIVVTGGKLTHRLKTRRKLATRPYVTVCGWRAGLNCPAGGTVFHGLTMKQCQAASQRLPIHGLTLQR